MPNWPVDDGPDFDFDERPVRESVIRKTRQSIMRTTPSTGLKTWNGNPVKTMESDHIMNAILFCEKRFADGIRNFRECFGENPGFYFESVFDMFPEYVNLKDEWNKRMERE